MKHQRPLALFTLLFASVAPAADPGANDSQWRDLLDGKLSQFDVYLSYRGDQIMSVLQGKAPKDLEPVGLNPPGQTVFSVHAQRGEPILRITGEYYGCLVTKEEFANYHFRASFRWGEKKW